MKKATKQDIEIIKQAFIEKYSDAVTELNYKNDYELLIAIILSAQCTDKRVNIITPALFEKYPSVKELAVAQLEDVKELLKTCSFFNNKAKNLLAMAQSVVVNFGGSIPHDEASLKSLAGVGQKTAHVFMIEFLQSNHMAVDTHVFRTAHRLGLSSAKTAVKTEEDLSKAYVSELATLHQAMVLFGRYICKAKNPLCETECFLVEFCKSRSNFKPA
mgnify:CR=1 FL=1